MYYNNSTVCQLLMHLKHACFSQLVRPRVFVPKPEAWITLWEHGLGKCILSVNRNEIIRIITLLGNCSFFPKCNRAVFTLTTSLSFYFSCLSILSWRLSVYHCFLSISHVFLYLFLTSFCLSLLPFYFHCLYIRLCGHISSLAFYFPFRSVFLSIIDSFLFPLSLYPFGLSFCLYFIVIFSSVYCWFQLKIIAHFFICSFLGIFLLFLRR